MDLLSETAKYTPHAIHITHPPDDRFLKCLRSELGGHRLTERITLTVGPDSPPPSTTTILVSGRPSQAELDACPFLTNLVVPYAGVPASTVALVKSRPGLQLRNLHHNATPTAEHAVALLLAAARRVVPCDAALRRGDWRARYEAERGMLLAERRALIVGYGHIGRRIGSALLGLGMSVAGVRRTAMDTIECSPSFSAILDCEASPSSHLPYIPIYGTSDLPSLLPSAEVLMICVPATDSTNRMFVAKELALLPHSALLVNVARAAVIDEAALYHSLASGHLAGAGLDVWWMYPEDEASRSDTPPSKLPFHELDSVVLSPHRAGHCDRTEELRARHLAQLIAAIARGDATSNVVNLDAGY